MQSALYPDSVDLPGLITAQAAAEAAAGALVHEGASEITVCRTSWIAAPLGGYLVDGLLALSTDSAEYTSFRVGVRDGSEGNPGEIFVTLLKGETPEGEVAWYPSPGPDYIPAEGDVAPDRLLDYEFLLDREIFESLESDFE
jgi:hypothetical protein